MAAAWEKGGSSAPKGLLCRTEQHLKVRSHVATNGGRLRVVMLHTAMHLMHSGLVLTLARLSVSVQAVAGAAAAGPGLVAAAQQADVGASSGLPVRSCFTRMAPDCGQIDKKKIKKNRQTHH